MEGLPVGPLAALLARMAVVGDSAVDVSGDELAGWPQDEVAALKAHRVLAPGKPAASAICPGCERACAMPVEVLPRPGRAAALFIVCDKPVDINRVPVAPAMLERWRMTTRGLADALARLIGSDGATPSGHAEQGFRLGVIKGRRDRSAVYLQANSGIPHLAVAGHELELSLVLTVQKQGLVLDLPRLARCVDAPAGGVGVPEEKPEVRRQRLAARVAREKANSTRAFLKVVAHEEGLSVSRLKQLLAAPPRQPADWTAPLSIKKTPSPKKTNR